MRSPVPAELMTGIKYHHPPSDAEPRDQPLAYVIHLADMKTMDHGIGAGVDTDYYSIDRSYIDHIRIPENELSELINKLEMDFQKTAGLLFD